MKKGLLVVGVVGMLFLMSGSAEASAVSQMIGKTWGYLFAPVNCIAQLSADLVSVGAKFVQCVIANANPANLIP